MSQQAAWDRLAANEADALAQLLATDSKCVMVIIIGADSDSFGTTHVCHAVAGETSGGHLRQFIAGAERKLTWLRDKLYRRA